MIKVKTTGIYKIIAKTNPSRFYIGSSLDIANRWRQHIYLLRKGTHHTPILQIYVNKHGVENLLFEIIEICQPEILIEREQFYYDTLKPYYNCKKDIINTTKGIKISEITRNRLRESHKGIHPSKETLRKRSIALKGKESWNKGLKSKQETRKKQSDALKGKTWDEIYGVDGANKRREAVELRRKIKNINRVYVFNP